MCLILFNYFTFFSVYLHSKEVISRQNFIAFLPAAPLQYVPKMWITPATIDCLTTNQTNNALHNETVILNYIGGDPISHSAWVFNHL